MQYSYFQKVEVTFKYNKELYPSQLLPVFNWILFNLKRCFSMQKSDERESTTVTNVSKGSISYFVLVLLPKTDQLTVNLAQKNCRADQKERSFR
ncbi:hypothetical protein ACG1BZ_22575 [Microbulbifer sp. CNSA002]|uniref:hypothetical protein n=1 Tax=Microbulbifer sp. CNSA002 TaxID=3373604 RepID=UPI0039B3E7E5